MSFLRKSMRKAAKSVQTKTADRNFRQKLASSVLAAGFAVSGFAQGSWGARVAEAAEGENGIVRVDGTPVAFDNNVANIYAEQVSAAGSVGLNRFTYFDVTNVQTANLFFQNEGGQTVNTLVNMVQNQINIAGTVNAVRNNQIGGHLFFLSPKGMVVSASGVINAGSLTVMTPTEDFFKKAGYGIKSIKTETKTGDKTEAEMAAEFVTTNIWKADAEKLQNFLALHGTYLAQGKMAGIDEEKLPSAESAAKIPIVEADIPINGDGSIAVHGKMNAFTAITLSAANIDVSKEEGADSGPLLQTGVLFNNVVNTEGKFTGATAKGVATVAELGAELDDEGNIVLVDRSNPTEDAKKGYVSKTTTTRESKVTTTTEKITTTTEKTGEETKTETENKTTTVTETVSTAVAEFVDTKGENQTTDAVFSAEKDKEYTKPEDTEDTKYTLSDDKKTLTATVTKTEEADGKTTKVTTKTETSEKSKNSELNLSTGTKPEVNEKYAQLGEGNILTGDGSIRLLAATAEANHREESSSGMVKFASWFTSETAIDKVTIKATLKDLLSETDFEKLSEDLLKTGEDEASLVKLWNDYVELANDTVRAEVTVGEGATIQAVGNAEISSSATWEQTLGEELEKTEGETGYNNLSKQFAQTQAITTVNGTVSGADVTISATAESSHTSDGSAGLGSILTENQKVSNLKKLLPDSLKNSKAGSAAGSVIELANELNVALGLTNSKAEVTVSETAVLTAETIKGTDGKALEYEKTNEDGTKENATVGGDINITSEATTTTDIQFAIKPKLKEGEEAAAGNVLLNGGFVWEQTGAEATIDVSGKTNATSEGSIIISATSTNSATGSVSIEAPEEGEEKIPSHFNVAVGLVNQNNKAKINISESGDAPTINATGGGLIIAAVTNTTTSSTVGVQADGNEAVSTAVNIVNTDTDATVENKAKLFGGLVSVSANDIVSGFELTTSNAYGPEDLSAFKKKPEQAPVSTELNQSTQENVQDLVNGAQQNANEANEENTEVTTPELSEADSWNKYFDVGAAVAVANAGNKAKVDLQADSALIGAAGVNVSSDVTVIDKQIKTTSILTTDMKNVKLGVSAAVAVEKMVNRADTIVADGVQLAAVVGDVSATAGVDDSYNRLSNMNESLKLSWELLKDGWNKTKDTAPEAAKTQWAKLTTSVEALLNFKSPSDSEEAAKAAAEAEEALGNLQMAGIEGLVGLVGAGLSLHAYTEAANWANMYTAASSRAATEEAGAKAMATGTVGIQNITDKANVNIGSGAVLISDATGTDLAGGPQGVIKTAAETKSGNVLIAGKWGLLPSFSSTSGGDFGIGGTVGVQNSDSKSEVIVNSGAVLKGGEVDVTANNDVMNIGIAIGGAKAGKLGITGMTSYMGGSSDSIVRVDDDAILAAARVYGEVEKEDKTKEPGDLATGQINITANNNTILTNVAGEVTRAEAVAIGASVGVISYDVHSKALVGNIEKNDTDGAATWSANSVNVKAENSGVINTLTVAGVTAKGQSSEAGSERSGVDVQVRNNHSEENDSTENPEGQDQPAPPAPPARTSTNNISVSSEGTGGNTDAPAPPASDDGNADDGNGAQSENNTDNNTKQASKVNIAVAGSVSWNDIDERTEAKLSQVAVELTKLTNVPGFTGTENKTVNVSTKDSTYIGAYSGAMALTKAGNTAGGSTEGNEGSGGKFAASLSGAVAVNDLYKNSVSEINGATIKNELGVNNTAENTGTQVAAGIALGIEQGDRTKAFGFNAAASGSFNFIDSTVRAQVKGANIAGSSADVNLNNTAYDKDIQIAGGITSTYAKSSAGLGAAIAVNKVKNTITADISSSTLGSADASLAAVNNFAVSKLTQIGGALSLGIVPGNESRNYLTANAAVAVNTVTNTLNATGSDNTAIYTKKLDFEARDGKLSTDIATGEFTQLKSEGFDVNDNPAEMEAVKGATEGNELNVVTKEDGSLEEDKEAEAVEYSQTNVTVTNQGNTIVGSAVGLGIKGGENNGASLGAGVVYNKTDNDFTAKLSGSTVHITAADTAEAPSVKVAANSDTLQVGVAAGAAVQTGKVKGAAAAGSVAIQRADNDTLATIENSTITADHTAVTAENKSTQTTVAGLVSGTMANAALGMTWAQNNLANTTGAYAKGIALDKFSADAAKTTDLLLDGKNTSKTLAVAAGVGAAIDTSGRSFNATAIGAYATNNGTNSTEAIMDGYLRDGAPVVRNTIKNAGSLTANAKDDSNLKGIAGTISVTAGKSKVGLSLGGAVVNNNIGKAGDKQRIRAEISEADIFSADTTAIEVKAENDAKLLTIGAGGAVAAGAGETAQASAQGSVALSDIHTDTYAGMNYTNIDNADGAGAKHNAVVNVLADSKSKITTTADTLSIGAGTGKAAIALGAAVSKVSSEADTTAEISGGTQNVKSELLKASSTNRLTDIAVAFSLGATSGLAGIGASSNVAINKIDNDTIARVKDNAVISATESLGVLADSSETLNNYGGALTIGASKKAGVAVGATVVINNIKGDTLSIVQDSTVSAQGGGDGIAINEYTPGEETGEADELINVSVTKTENVKKKGIVLNADAEHKFNDISVTAGIGGSVTASIGLNATVANNTINGSTQAQLLRSDVNKDLASLTDNSNLSVTAHDKTDVSAHIGTLSVAGSSTLGVAAVGSVDVNNFDRTTNAEITGKTGKSTVNAASAEVKALNDTSLLLTESGLGVGIGLKVGIGLTGVVSVNNYTNKSYATMANVTGQQNQVNIDAESVKLLRSYTNAASVSGGYVAVAASASVLNVKDTSETAAKLENSTLKADKTKRRSGRVDLQANSHAVLGSQTAGGALAIGLGGAAGVTVATNNFKNTTSVTVLNSTVGEADAAYAAFDAKAKNTFTDKFLNISASGGLVGISVGVANNTVNSASAANVSGGTIYADRIGISAAENRTVKEDMVSASIGGGAVNTNVSITTIGGSLLDTYDEKTAKGESKSYSTGDIQKLSLQGDKEAQSLNNTLAANKYAKDIFTADGTDLKYDKGTKSAGVQTNLNGAVLRSGGDINISSHATTNTDIQVVQGSVGIVGASVAVATTTVGTDSGVTVRGGDIQGKNVNINSLSDGTLKQDTTQISAGGVSAAVSVSKLTREGRNIITIGDGSSATIIRAGIDESGAAPSYTGSALTIRAEDSTTLQNTAMGTSTGVGSATAQVIKALDYSDTKIDIKGGADLRAVDYYGTSQTLKWEPGRAGTINDAQGNTLYTIEFTPRTSDTDTDKTVIKDADGNIVKTIWVAKDGTTTSSLGAEDTDPWSIGYTVYRPVYGSIDISATNRNTIKAELGSGSGGGISGEGVVVLAEEGKRDSKGNLEKGLTAINVSGANTFAGSSVSLAAENKARAYADEFAFGLSILSASVINTTANLQGGVTTDIANGQTFLADKLRLSAEAVQPTASDTYSAKAHTQGISTGGANVAVYNATAKTGLDTKLSVGNETYLVSGWNNGATKDNYNKADGSKIDSTDITLAGETTAEGGTQLELKAQSTASTKSDVSGINGSVVSSGNNQAYTENKNTVTLNFNPGTYRAGSLNLTADNTDTVSTTANGDGGSIVDVSPYAARATHTNASTTTINLSGTYELTGDMVVKATTGLNQEINASAVKASVVGGSGTVAGSTTDNTAQVKLDNAVINAGGSVDIGAFNKITFNKNTEYAVKGNGFGAGTVSVAKFSNSVTTNSKVDLGSSRITSAGAQTYHAETDNDLNSKLYVLSAGVIAGAHGENNLTVKATDTVAQGAGGLLSVNGRDRDIILSALDNQKVDTHTMVDNVGGAVAGSSAIVTNTLTRTNKIDVAGDIYSRHDVKLLAGQSAAGKLGQMTLDSSAEAMTVGLIPVALPPTLKNKFIQENQVTVAGSGKVQAVRNVNLYADAGKESTDLFSGRYTMYGGKGESNYAATTNGESNIEGRGGIEGKTADNFITVDGTVLAGAGKKQIFNIGAENANLLIVTDKDQYDVVNAYYDAHPAIARQNVVLVLSDADYEKQKDSLGGRTAMKLSDLLKIDEETLAYSGVKPEDFKIYSNAYAAKKLERLQELQTLMNEYEKSDPTAYVGYKADYDRLYGELQDERLIDAQGKIISDFMVATVELPDLAASGGNVLAQSPKFKGEGSVTAQGNPDITINNNTSLATVINNITVYEPGGDIYYNSVLLDTTDPRTPEKVNGATVKTLKSEHGTDSTININGKNNISDIYYRLNELPNESDRDKRGPIKADLIIQGQVLAEGGTVNISSQNDSIVIEGRTAGEAAAVVGKTVNMSAKGNISQGYKDDIENIGGDPQAQFGNQYSGYTYTNGTSGVYNQSKGIQVASKSRISGGSVYINASDVNINGTIQSGYEKYFVSLSDETLLDANNKIVPAGTAGAKTLVDRIASIKSYNGGKTVTDASVIGNPNYQVVSGSEVKNSSGYYDYMINVYYNPSSGKLLTEDIDSKGGRVYITGRISSTGAGEIFCLDGTYNIDITNSSKYLLQTGKLVVNDAAGEVKITDTTQNTITTITRDTDGTHTSFEKIFKDKDYTGSAVLGAGTGSYDFSYKPQAGLRYNWTTGFNRSQTKTYRRTWYNARWGKGSDNEVNKELINAESNTAPISTGPESTYNKRNGAYIGQVSGKSTPDFFDVIYTYTYAPTLDETKITNRREWKQGAYGCHHYTELTWDHLTGSSNSFLASVKADNPVGIKFIGDATANSTVTVNSAAGLLLGGDVGNTALYESGTNRMEKGSISLTSANGTISQLGGALYGSTISTEANGSIENINVIAGDSVELKALKHGDPKDSARDISFTVGSNKSALGNAVISGTFGSADTDTVVLTNNGNRGDITTADGAVIEGRRIDLTTGNGSISATVKAGQEFVGTDTLSASLNATAKGDITLTQQSGDMRIGRIYSDNGDVTLNSTQSFVDALPYVSMQAGSEDEQVAKWLKAGLISDSTASTELQEASKQMLKEKNGAIGSADFMDSYKKGVADGYARYQELQKMSGRTPEQEKELEGWKEVFDGYTGADDFLARNEAAKKLQTEKTYQQWDKTALLYAIQQSIINQTSDKLLTTSSKDPNVKGNNITLNAGTGAGLLSDTVTTMHADTLGDSTVIDELTGKSGLENLKTLARADASNVLWDSTADGGRGVITIIQKLPIGVQTNRAEGLLTVGKYDAGELKNMSGDAFLEGRTVVDATVPGNTDLTIGAIKAEGNVSVTSLGAISNGAAPGTAAITGNNLNITAVGSIGSADKLLTTDLKGALRAVGYRLPAGALPTSGGIYLDNIGASDLGILSVSTGGTLDLRATQSIISVDNSADIKGVIETEHKGDITLISREGSLGSAKRSLLVKNAEDATGKVTAGAAMDIYLEGISTAADQRTAGGQLNLVLKAQGGASTLENLSVKVNGDLNLLSSEDEEKKLTATKSITLEAANDMALKDMELQAKNVSLQAGEVTTVHGHESKNAEADLKLAGSKITAAETASLSAARDLQLADGSISATTASLKAGRDLQQSYTISADGTTPVSGGSITATNLTASSTGALDLGSGFNKLENVALDNLSKTGANNSVILGNGGSEALTVQAGNSLTGQDNIINGTLTITNYDDKTAKNDLRLSQAKATGDITLINHEQDILTGTAGTDNIASYGDILVKAKGDITNSADMTAAGSITLSSGKDTTNSGTITTNEDVQLTAQGSITNSGAMAAVGDILVNAGSNITNNNAIDADGYVKMKAGVDLTNNGLSGGDDDLISGSLGVELTAGGKLVNDNHLVSDAGDIVLTAGTLIYNMYDRQGHIEAAGSVIMETTVSGDRTLDADDSIINGGIIVANGVIPTTVHSLGEREWWKEQVDTPVKGNVILHSYGDIINSGDISTSVSTAPGETKTEEAGTIVIDSWKSVTNSGNLKAANSVELDATDAVLNEGDIIADNGHVYITSYTAGVTNLDDIKASGDVKLAAVETINISKETFDRSIHGDISNTGTIEAGSDVKLVTYNGSLYNEKSIQTGTGDVTLAAKQYADTTADPTDLGNIVNAGDIKVTRSGDTIFTAERSVTNAGRIEAAGSVIMETEVAADPAQRGRDADDYIANAGNIQAHGTTATTKHLLGDREWWKEQTETAVKGNVILHSYGDIINEGDVSTGVTAAPGETLPKDAGSIIIDSWEKVTNSGSLQAASSVELDATADVKNSGDIIADNGHVYITSYMAGVTNLDDIKASEDVKLAAVETINISKEAFDRSIRGDILNNGTIDAGSDVKLVTYNGKLYNEKSIQTEAGDVTLTAKQYAGTTADTTDLGDIVNEGDISVLQNGTITLYGDDDVINTGNFVIGNDGSITLHAADGIRNGSFDSTVDNGVMVIGGKGDINLQVDRGTIYNYKGADMLAADGNVTLASTSDVFDVYYYDAGGQKHSLREMLLSGVITHQQFEDIVLSEDGTAKIIGADGSTLYEGQVFINGSVFNSGDIMAIGGKIALSSLKGDVYNFDDFNTLSSLESDSKTGKYITPGGHAIMISTGDIEMRTPEGLLYNQHALISDGSVTLEAAEGLDSLGQSIYAGGDVSLTATQGDLFNLAQIVSLEGDVNLKAENGTVVNMLNADIFALSGSVNIQAGGTIPEGDVYTALVDGVETTCRSLYTVDAVGNITQLAADVDANKKIVVDKYYLVGGTGEAKLIDDTVVKAELSQAEQDSIYGIIKEVVRSKAVAGQDKKDEELKELTGRDGSVLKIMGDIEVYRLGDVVNRGDIVALGRTEQQPDGSYLSVNPGTITLESAHGNSSNYDNFRYVDGKETYDFDGEGIYNPDTKFYKGKKYMISAGNLTMAADEGYIYNKLNFISGSDATIRAKNDIDVSDYVAGIVAGELTINSTAGRITSDADLGAGKGIVLGAAKDVTSTGSLTSGEGLIRISSEEGDVTLAGTISSGGSTDSEGNLRHGSIDIGATTGNVNAAGANIISTDLSAIGAKEGNITAGTVRGNEVILYSNGTDKAISANEVSVKDYLLLRGDVQEIANINRTDTEGWLNVEATGANGGAIKNSIKHTIEGDTRYTALNATNAEVTITEGGKLAVDKLHIAEAGHFAAMDYLTAVYGIPMKNETSKAVYFDVSTGKGETFTDTLPLDKLLFGAYGKDQDITDTEPGYKKPIYVNDVRTLVAERGQDMTDTFRKPNEGWMNLYIDKDNFQRSSGILLNLKTYYYSNDQRYAANDFATMLADTKAANVYTGYYEDNIGMFNRFNLIDLPAVSAPEAGSVDLATPENGIITIATISTPPTEQLPVVKADAAPVGAGLQPTRPAEQIPVVNADAAPAMADLPNEALTTTLSNAPEGLSLDEREELWEEEEA